MKILVSKSAKTKLPELTVTLSGDPATLDRVCAMLYMASWSSLVGHSGSFAVDVDGDGADRLTIKGLDKDREKVYKEMAEATSGYGAAFEVAGNDRAYVYSNGKQKLVYPKEE